MLFLALSALLALVFSAPKDYEYHDDIDEAEWRMMGSPVQPPHLDRDAGVALGQRRYGVPSAGRLCDLDSIYGRRVRAGTA